MCKVDFMPWPLGPISVGANWTWAGRVIVLMHCVRLARVVRDDCVQLPGGVQVGERRVKFGQVRECGAARR